jgi:hypothetical protein
MVMERKQKEATHGQASDSAPENVFCSEVGGAIDYTSVHECDLPKQPI